MGAFSGATDFFGMPLSQLARRYRYAEDNILSVFWRGISRNCGSSFQRPMRICAPVPTRPINAAL